MIDLHCHIMPGIDDGPDNIVEVLMLLKEESNQGIRKIVMTPHYHPAYDSLDDFLLKREEEFQNVCNYAKRLKLPLQLKVGAEVYFSVDLGKLDLRPLCFRNTDYLLFELPTDYKVSGVMDTCYRLQQKGYVPILAHVERYPCIRKNPVWLYEFVCAGNLVQINAEALLGDTNIKKFVKKLIDWEMVHLISTDTHSIKESPPRLKEALLVVEKECGIGKSNALKKNAELVFEGKELGFPEPHKPEHIFGIWK